ncbi:MAG TPA: L-seryl-tRNA(Sec) selenium transferase [Chthoniobacterales bacterium]|nr:L-seryl-tRNA(Sec) selenium transferase [Chthoniobacterales bacterium]
MERVVGLIGESGLPRRAVVAIVRREISAVRTEDAIPNLDSIVARVQLSIDELRRAKLQPVINGTGIIIHTNLGRAPLSAGAIDAMGAVGAAYNNLEYDLTRGARGARAGYVEHNLAVLCHAEAATVVNNCAAALILIVRHFTATKKEVVISRGELVQIGGGFRIPEILEASGAKLREVGTTNRTGLDDYAKALGPETAMILKVHRSNFFMGGFVEAPDTAALSKLARTKRILFVEDLGSGAVIETEEIAGIEHEPTPEEILQRGADLVCFSGDKLFGGPQAGIIAGKRRHVVALKRNPFFRALRCDKLILAALQATVDCHLSGQSFELPALALMRVTTDELRARGERLIAQIRDLPLRVTFGEAKAEIGGGTLPRSVISSITLDLVPEKYSLDEFASRLRRGSPAVIGYLAGQKFRLDLRTIFPRQDESLADALRAAAR